MPAASSRRIPQISRAIASRALLALVFALGMVAPGLARVAPVAAQTESVTFSTAEAAPADSVAYLVATTDDRSAQWQLADQLLTRAGLGETIHNELAKELQDEGGDQLPLDAFLGGEVAVVVNETAVQKLAESSMNGSDLDEMLGSMGLATPEPAPTGPEPQGFAVILDPRAPDTAWAGIQDSIRDKPNEEIDYQGTTILSAPAQSADDEPIAAARAGDLILIAMAPQDLEPVIDTTAGRAPSIATTSEFTRAREALPDTFLLFALVNNAAASTTDLGPFSQAAASVQTQGVAASTIAADDLGFRMESVELSPAGETLPAAAANFESQLATVAPDNALLFMSGANLGETGALDALGAMLLTAAFGMTGATATPVPGQTPEEAVAAQYQSAAALLGVNFQTDLFQQLVGEYGLWLTADMAAQQASGLFASETKDPAKVESTLMQLSFLIQGAASSGSPVTTREVDGGQVYVIPLGEDGGPTIEFGVVQGQFVIGSGEAIDRLAGASGSSLADNAQYQAVMGALPAAHNGLVYIDLAQAIPLLQSVEEHAPDIGLGAMGETQDASEDCGSYTTQADAQAAYDAADPGTFDLDQDFDGEVCEDYFVSAVASPQPVAAQEAPSGDDEGSDAFDQVDLSGIKAFASVSYDENGLRRSSAILYIP
jgi:hypothetical protein